MFIAYISSFEDGEDTFRIYDIINTSKSKSKRNDSANYTAKS